MNQGELQEIIRELDEVRTGMFKEFIKCAHTPEDDEIIARFMDYQERHQVLLAKAAKNTM